MAKEIKFDIKAREELIEILHSDRIILPVFPGILPKHDPALRRIIIAKMLIRNFIGILFYNSIKRINDRSAIITHNVEWQPLLRQPSYGIVCKSRYQIPFGWRYFMPYCLYRFS